MSAEESKLIAPVGVKVSGIKSQSIEEQDNQKKGVWTAKQQCRKRICATLVKGRPQMMMPLMNVQ